MTEVNWNSLIERYHGEFLHRDDYVTASFLHKRLAGYSQEEMSLEELLPCLSEYSSQMMNIEQSEKEENYRQNVTGSLRQAYALKKTQNLVCAHFKCPEFPRDSNFSCKEQTFVVQKMLQFMAGSPTSALDTYTDIATQTTHDLEEYRQLLLRMRTEQSEYLEFARDLNRTKLARYNYSGCKIIVNHVNRSFQADYERVLGCYPRHYAQIAMLGLVAAADTTGSTAPSVDLCQVPGASTDIGLTPDCRIPALCEPVCRLDKQINYLTAMCSPTRYPCCTRYDNALCDQSRGRFLYKQTLCRDPNVDVVSATIAAAAGEAGTNQHPVQVALTPGVLKRLACAGARSQWTHAWQIPVIVRRYADGRRLLILDKPVKAATITNMERNARAYKRACRFLLCKRHLVVHDPSATELFAAIAEPAEPQSTPTTGTQAAKRGKRNKAGTHFLCEYEHLYRQIIPDQMLAPPPGISFNYRAWTFGDLHLLIRSHNHGRIGAHSGCGGDGGVWGDKRTCSVHTKPAYQANLGIEVPTLDEIVAQWIDCVLRPGSCVVRAHMDPGSRQLILCERLVAAQLAEQLHIYRTELPTGAQILRSVHGVLQQLVAATAAAAAEDTAATLVAPHSPDGRNAHRDSHFLLQHDARTSAFVRLARAIDLDSADGTAVGRISPFNVDLHSHLPAGLRVNVQLFTTPPWLPIDTTVLTPFNLKYNRVPALFNYKVSKKSEARRNKKRKQNASV